MGALGYTAFNALFYLAAHHTSALNLSIIQGAIPALVLIGARVFLRRPASPLQALGAAATMAGVATIAAEGDPARLAALEFNQGDLMMLAAVVLYAGYTIGSARSAADFRPRAARRHGRGGVCLRPCR